MNTKAFPHSFERVPDHPCFSESEGMDLRDYFAAKAMQGMLANQHQFSADDESIYARDAYAIADAMMKAREK